jgi:hypothetical protein
MAENYTNKIEELNRTETSTRGETEKKREGER